MTMLADAKTLLGIENTDTVGIAILNLILPTVLAKAASFLGASFTPAATGRVEYKDGGVLTYFLDYLNASSVVVEVDDEVIEEDQYVVDSKRGVVRFRSYIAAEGVNNVKFTYSGGYADGSIPEPIKGAILQQIMYAYRRRRDPGLSSVTAPDGTVQKFDTGAWVKDAREVLELEGRIGI